MFEHANIRKHVYKHICSSVRVFLSILTHLAHLALYKKVCQWAYLLICEGVFNYSSSLSSFSSVFFLIFNGMNIWYKYANTRKHVSEHSWSSGWMILSILAHLDHLAQSYFSLIFSEINTYNGSWLDLTNKKNQ